MNEAGKPGLLERLRARYPLFDHAMRAYQRFSERRGTFFAAGLSYYTIFALFPILMIGFAVLGFSLSLQPRLIATIEGQIRSVVTGDLAKQLIELMHAAIDSRASVGVIGLTTAVWAGLSWIWHLREALSEMWEQDADTAGFVRTKLSDLLAMVSTFVVTLATVGLTTLSNGAPMFKVLHWLGVHYSPVLDAILRSLSLVMSLLVSWGLFTYVIARLPREPTRFATSARAGLIAAVGFELFKQVASIYLRSVLRGPAGATFGPVLGLMVFVFVTACLVLFAAAWAATSGDDPRTKPALVPAPAIIAPRVHVDEGLRPGQTVAAMVVGAIGALAFSRFKRRRR